MTACLPLSFSSPHRLLQFHHFYFHHQAIICSITCIYFDELKPYKSDKGKSTTSSKYGTSGSSGNSTSVGLKEKRGTGGGKLRTTSKAVNGEATPLLLA